MNRLVVVLIIVFINIVTSENSSNEESGETNYTDLIACKNETGASDIDVARVLIRANPITQNGKCLLQCYVDKLAVMTKEQIVTDNLLDYVDDVTLVGSNGKTLDQAMKEIVDDCKTLADADKCELTARRMNCLNASARKRGFCPNVF